MKMLLWQVYTALGIIILFIGFLILEIYAVFSSSSPKKLMPIAVSLIFGCVGAYGIYTYWPLGFSFLTASISGVYDWQGYLYAVGIMALILAFGFNAFKSWNQNKPFKLIR